MSNLYQEDLAYVHHAGFGDFARRVAPAVLAMLQQAGIRQGRVVDLGCGSGIWAQILSEAGYSVLGIDVSPAMVALARRVAPDATFETASLHEAEIPPCAAVTALGEGLGYLPSPDVSALPFPVLFRRVAEALPAGGLFVFDVMLHAGGRPIAYRSWQGGDDWAVLVDVREDRERRLLQRDITTFRRVGEGYRRSEERHRVCLPTRQEVEGALRESGFSVQVLRGYGDFPLAPRRAAFRARKR